MDYFANYLSGIDREACKIVKQIFNRALFAMQNVLMFNVCYSVDLLALLEIVIKPIDLVILNQSESAHVFSSKYLAISDYLTKRQTCVLTPTTTADKINHLVSPNIHYGIVTGCQLSGKKTLLKEVKRNLGKQIIYMDKLIQRIKAAKADADNGSAYFVINILILQ